jgi:predicted dienelactone hydrolase
MKHVAAIALLMFAASCATVPRGAITDPTLAGFAQPGPFRVVQYDLDWFDVMRQRHVPVHIYAPQSPPAVLPAIVFSHGLGNSRFGYGYLGLHWASYGYVSVHPEHIGADRDAARRGWLHLFRSGFDRRNWKNIPEDIHFVIDQLQKDDALPPALRGHIDGARIGISGHSLGAYGALAMGGLRVLFPDGTVVNFRDRRVRAAVPISMSENFQPASYTDVGIPMLHVTGTRDWDPLYGTWSRKRRVPFNSIQRDDQYLVVVGGANHSTFSEDENNATRAAHDVVRTTTILFWNAYLRDEGAALAALREGELPRALGGLARFSIKDTPKTRIGKISIQTAPLFDAQEASRGGFYRAANLVAVKTPQRLVRRFLLFREGDEFDPAKIAETERNLRAFEFLKSASVTAGEPHDGVVDVVVSTQDAWTTEVDADFSNDGGRSLYDFAVTQLDLFGKGSQLGIRTANGRERRANSLEFFNPTVFGRYWNAHALLSKNSDGNEERLSIERPLFASATHFTMSATADHLLQTARVFENAAITSLFRQKHRELSFMIGPAIVTGAAGNTRLLAGVDFRTDTFAPVRGLAPDDRRFRFVQFGLDSTEFRLVKADHVDFGLREQDFNLGRHASVDVGHSAGNIWRLRTEDSFGHRIGTQSFVLTRLAASTRAGATNRNTIWSDDTRLVVKIPTEYAMTFVSRLRIDFGSHLDRDVQFFADGQNGLRAYPNFAFEGSRRILFNMEDRLFLGHEWLQLFEPAAAIFFDSGQAVNHGPLRLRGFRSDVGAGLRFGIARYESAIIRVDAAYALNGSPISKRGLVISIATTQAF